MVRVREAGTECGCGGEGVRGERQMGASGCAVELVLAGEEAVAVIVAEHREGESDALAQEIQTRRAHQGGGRERCAATRPGGQQHQQHTSMDHL